MNYTFVDKISLRQIEITVYALIIISAVGMAVLVALSISDMSQENNISFEEYFIEVISDKEKLENHLLTILIVVAGARVIWSFLE